MRARRIVCMFLAVAMLFAMMSVISVSAYTDTRTVRECFIYRNGTSTVVAEATYSLTYYSEQKCFEAKNQLTYQSNFSYRNFSGYTKLIIAYTNSEYNDLERECGYIFSGNQSFSTYAYIPANRTWSSATALFHTNITDIVNGNTYEANLTYSSFSYVMEMTNP